MKYRQLLIGFLCQIVNISSEIVDILADCNVKWLLLQPNLLYNCAYFRY